jgi:hypothetical protein
VFYQNTIKVRIACALGIIYGKYKNERDFNRLFKSDLYPVFAYEDELYTEAVKGIANTARDESLQFVAEILMKKWAPKGLSKIPVVGTVWGVASGAWSGVEAGKFGKATAKYYNKSDNEKPTFVFDFVALEKAGINQVRVIGFNGMDTKFNIPNRYNNQAVEIIGPRAFEGKQIQSVTLGEFIKEIERAAFKNCRSLTTVVIPQKIDKIKIASDAFEGTNLDEASKNALRRVGFTGTGVGTAIAQPQTPPSITVQNNTGAAIGIIERKNGSNWTSLSTNRVVNGNKSEVITLTPGSYDIRIRAAGSDPFNPKTVMFVKNGVKTSANTTTNVTFTANDKYWTRKEYQAFIQARCKFGDPDGVWRVMDTHTSADTLYKMWAESYPSTSSYKYPQPRTGYSGIEADKEIIQAQCKFSNKEGVWNVIEKHKNSSDLYRVWANSYYTGSQVKAEPQNPPPPPPPPPAQKPPPQPKTLTTTEYKNMIQARCKFGNPGDVWAVMDTYPNASALYKKWAESYPSGYLSNKPNRDDKDIIQAQCKFENPQAVWNTIEKHKFAKNLLQVWADSYYNRR